MEKVPIHDQTRGLRRRRRRATDIINRPINRAYADMSRARQRMTAVLETIDYHGEVLEASAYEGMLAQLEADSLKIVKAVQYLQGHAKEHPQDRPEKYISSNYDVFEEQAQEEADEAEEP
jgi:hypothetical protein